MHIKTSNQPGLKLGIGNYTCNWGVHMCGLYETEKERDEIILGYLKYGCLANDKQIFIFSEQTEENFRKNFHHSCPTCLSNDEQQKRLDIKKAQDIYYPDGDFDPWKMDITINGYYDYTQLDGKNNLRAVAEMCWALQKIEGAEHLFAYESRLNYFVQDKSIISLCLYNVTKIDSATIMNVLRTHPFTISGGIITQNPYFVQPDKWLAENAPQFLNPNS
ncbi:MAG: MEDS domain-containing protein [Bacteroidales bacterium]|nr:MEDS domain-containing protein [Bacteroidales bacterium]